MKKTTMRRLERLGIEKVTALKIYYELSNYGRDYISKKRLMAYVKEALS